MKKENIHKLLYAVAALLVLGFAIHTTVDAVRYDSMLTSFPFYAFLLVNAAIYLVPSLIVFITALIVKKKVNTKSNNK